MNTTEKTKAPTQEDGATANFNTDFSTQNDTTQAVSVEERIEMATKLRGARMSAVDNCICEVENFLDKLRLSNLQKGGV